MQISPLNPVTVVNAVTLPGLIVSAPRQPSVKTANIMMSHSIAEVRSAMAIR